MNPSDPEQLLVEGATCVRSRADLVAGAADVDDLVQETWLRRAREAPRGFSLRAGSRPGEECPHASGGGRTSGVSHTVARDRQPRRRPAPSADDPADVAARFNLVRRVFTFVDQLAEPHRTTLLRRYLDGSSRPRRAPRRPPRRDRPQPHQRGLTNCATARRGERRIAPRVLAVFVPWRGRSQRPRPAAATLAGELLWKAMFTLAPRLRLRHRSMIASTRTGTGAGSSIRRRSRRRGKFADP